MGTTSEKLTYLNTTKTLIKEELNLGGANITNEPFRQYKSKLEGIYKDFLANGTDTLWNNWLPKVNGTGETITLNNTIEAKMDFVYKGNTSQTGTPTPDTPIPVQVVSGDNSIKVEGKNLFNLTNQTTTINGVAISVNGSEITLNGTCNSYGELGQKLNIKLNSNESYYLSVKNFTYNAPVNFMTPEGFLYNNVGLINNKSKITRFQIQVVEGQTYNNLTYQIQLEKASTATTYEPYQSQSYSINLGDIELCKIGDYQDSIKKSTGKNLFDKDNINIQNGYLDYNGFFVSANDWWGETSFIKIKPNTQYTFSCRNIGARFIWCEYTNDSVGSIVGQRHEGSTTFTTSNTSQYIRFCTKSTTTTDIQLNEGSTALPYEPYGKVWYLNKQIGKITLSNSDNFILDSYSQRFTKVLDTTCEKAGYSNRYIYGGTYQTTGKFEILNNGRLAFSYPDSNIDTVAKLQTYLTTNELYMYLPLSNSTTTEITDTTLISQLEAIKKSYNTQTNISQTNNDKSFILDVVALGN